MRIRLPFPYEICIYNTRFTLMCGPVNTPLELRSSWGWKTMSFFSLRDRRDFYGLDLSIPKLIKEILGGCLLSKSLQDGPMDLYPTTQNDSWTFQTIPTVLSPDPTKPESKSLGLRVWSLVILLRIRRGLLISWSDTQSTEVELPKSPLIFNRREWEEYLQYVRPQRDWTTPLLFPFSSSFPPNNFSSPCLLSLFLHFWSV